MPASAAPASTPVFLTASSHSRSRSRARPHPASSSPRFTTASSHTSPKHKPTPPPTPAAPATPSFAKLIRAVAAEDMGVLTVLFVTRDPRLVQTMLGNRAAIFERFADNAIKSVGHRGFVTAYIKAVGLLAHYIARAANDVHADRRDLWGRMLHFLTGMHIEACTIPRAAPHSRRVTVRPTPARLRQWTGKQFQTFHALLEQHHPGARKLAEQPIRASGMLCEPQSAMSFLLSPHAGGAEKKRSA